MRTQDLIVSKLPDYQLLDSGHGDKLERIAGHLVQRPCPQAIWPKRLPGNDWQRARSLCLRTADGGGSWQHHAGEPKGLRFHWQGPLPTPIRLHLRFTSFGHCGVFMEHSALWAELAQRTPGKMLNLFGYTGAASLAAAATGAEVFHVDSAKGVLDWGKQNVRLNPDLPGRIRWIHDDARASLGFSKKRGFRYDLILMDPPSWGHGTSSKDVFTFDSDVSDMVADAMSVLAPGGHLIFSCHTPGVQTQAIVNLIDMSSARVLQAGELGLRHQDD
ncbi:MAG: class I SAM-dependent methyltransferase, partial [Planctomycetota bacterium]